MKLIILYLSFCHIFTTHALNCDQPRNPTGTSIQKWKAIHELVRLVCFQILIPCICVIGITTNLMNIAVLARPRMRSSTSMYLLALAVCDLVYGCILALMSLRTVRILESSFTYMVTFPVQMAIGNLCSNMATWLTCAFTVERFVAITFPILARKVCTRRRCKWIIGSLFVFTFLITLPDFFTKEIRLQIPRLYTHQNCNQTRLLSEPKPQKPSASLPYRLSDSAFGRQLQNFGWPIILIVLVFILPLLLLTIFNGLLIRSVVKTYSYRRCPVAISRENKNGSFERTRSSQMLVLSFGQSSYKTSCRKTTNENLEAEHDQMSPHSQNNHEKVDQTVSFQFPKSSEPQLNEFGETRVEIEETEEEDAGQTTVSTGQRSRLGRVNFRAFVGPGMSERHRITVMLIVVVLTFCIFTLPSAAIHLVAELRTADNGVGDIKTRIAGNFANLALAINSSLNFFLYSWLSKGFRRTFRSLFNCRASDF